MNQRSIARREWLTLVGGAVASTAAAGETPAGCKPAKVVVVGAHPDDPESTCGGTMLRLVAAGHEVVSAYLTRGEAGISGISHEEAARIRTAEAERACGILSVRPVFLGQMDGATEVTPTRYQEMQRFLDREKPGVVFVHWPIDTHRDHRIASVLVYDAWLALGRPFALLYCEAMLGEQSQVFTPTDYVDISAVAERKRAACHAHRSQDVEGWYESSHGRMEVFRGMEAGVPRAEAFVRHLQSRSFALP
jgi:LmbE family N-acetylglucosaminyl deacetylase